MRLLRNFLIECLVVLPCLGQNADVAGQKRAIASFYATVLSFRSPGIPSRTHIQKLSPFISGTLHSLLLQALNAERTYAQKNQEAVPPLIESRVFFSLFEGATSRGAISLEPGGTFLVELTYAEGDKPTVWKDRVFLVSEHHRWVVDDIELLGGWEFGDKGRVQENLRSAIQEAQETQPE